MNRHILLKREAKPTREGGDFGVWKLVKGKWVAICRHVSYDEAMSVMEAEEESEVNV